MQTEDELIVKLRASVTHSTLWILAFQEDRRMQKLVTVLRAEEVTQIWPDSMLEKELNVGVSGDGDKLNRVWHLLRFAGWKLAPTYSRPEGGQPSWYGRFTNPDSAFSIWLNFTSTVCRRVQVGTEMKEVPVYEVRCGESSLEPEAPSAPVAVSVSDDEIPF